MISAATRASSVNFLIKIIISRQFNISYTIIAVFQVNAMIKLSDKYNIHRVGGKTCADPEIFCREGGGEVRRLFAFAGVGVVRGLFFGNLIT